MLGGQDYWGTRRCGKPPPHDKKQQKETDRVAKVLERITQLLEDIARQQETKKVDE